MTPAGKKEILKAGANPQVFAETSEAGFYRYQSAVKEGRFAVNLFDEAESEIRPRAQAVSTEKKIGDGAAAVEAGYSLWPILLACVLACSG
jgi:hypothetical protein